jgi:hypothetical protein
MFSIIGKDSTVKSKKSSRYTAAGDLFQPIASEAAEAGETIILPLVVKETEETDEQCYENTTFISTYHHAFVGRLITCNFFSSQESFKTNPSGGVQ